MPPAALVKSRANRKTIDHGRGVSSPPSPKRASIGFKNIADAANRLDHFFKRIIHLRQDDAEDDKIRYLTDKLAAIRADMAVDAGPQSLNREWNIIRAADKAYAVRVLDEAGRVVTESPKMRRVLPIEVFPTTLSTQGQRPTTLHYHARNGKTFALVTAAADLGTQRRTLQLAQKRTHDEKFRAR